MKKLLAVLAGIVLASSAVPAQSPCTAGPALQPLAAYGGLAPTGASLVAEEIPLAGSPFQLRVTGGPPDAHGCVLSSLNEASMFVPEFGATFHPAPPLFVELFDLDGQGSSPPLLQLPSVSPSFCGIQFTSQALILDGTALGGVLFTDGLRVRFGSSVGASPLLDPPTNPTSATAATISGIGSQVGDSILLRGEIQTVQTVVGSDLRFSASVPLAPNQKNTIYVSEVFPTGEGPPSAAQVIQDMQPPSVFLDFPSAGAELSTPTTNVSGRVSDLLSGFAGLTVTVNGLPAVVDPGIGTNGTFTVFDLPLNAVGSTTITAEAADGVGNLATASTTAQQVSLVGAHLVAVSGDGQQGAVQSLLPAPIEVQVLRDDGTPFANKVVQFLVTRSDGRLTADGVGDGGLMLQALTDASGTARARWRLGGDAGCGNDRVEATSAGIAGTAYFAASATPGPPSQLNVGSGNGQVAAAGAPAPEPLRVWVSDSCNGIEGLPVTFTVTQGSGTLFGAGFLGAGALTVPTDSTGHAQVQLRLDADEGTNLVEATFPGNPGAPVVFSAFGREALQATTTFEGVVLDNAKQPIEGATCRLTVDGSPELVAVTDADGVFSFAGLPGGGPAQLHVEGSTAIAVGGVSVSALGVRFPDLPFEPLVIPFAANALPRPVLLPRLEVANDVVYTGGAAELTVAGIEGLEMIVQPGSMTLPDGTQPSPSNPVVLSLNQVHHDDVPMPMPDGAAPPFAWTLQPAGARFDPPVQIVYPNMTGLPPGAASNFLSFDHDTGRFEIVASGRVSADGSRIVTDAGSGLSLAGWGCNCPPYSVTAQCCHDGASGSEGGSSSACNECKDGKLIKKSGPCDDGNPCTMNDVCVDGKCKGTPISGECDPNAIWVIDVQQNAPTFDDSKATDNVRDIKANWSLCLDTKSKAWRFQPGKITITSDINISLAAPGCPDGAYFVPNPVPGGNIGDCLAPEPGTVCWSCVVNDLMNNKFAQAFCSTTVDALLAHELEHTADILSTFEDYWLTQFLPDIVAFSVPCSVPQAQAFAKAEMVIQTGLNETLALEFKKAAGHDDACNTDAPYQAGFQALIPTIQAVQQFALDNGFVDDTSLCGPPPGGIVCFGEEFPDSTAVELLSVDVTSSESLLTTGGTTQLTVTATYDDASTQDLTFDPAVVYESSSPQVCSVDASGLVTALTPGVATIRARVPSTVSFEAVYLSDAEIIEVAFPDDQDADLIPDSYEAMVGLDPSNPADALLDPDGDGLTNVDEYLHGSKIDVPDTDGDGIDDGTEVAAGLDPASPPRLSAASTVDVGGQVVQANADGTFLLSNVAAPDVQFPFGLSDDAVRAVSVEVAPGLTIYAFGSPFQFAQGQSFVVPDLTYTTTPPPLPVSLGVVPVNQSLPFGQSLQLAVTGVLQDGSLADLTPATTWTSYRTSNPNVVDVDPDGLVTAVGAGAAFVTVSNEGATAVVQVTVPQAIVQTTVVGFVLELDGTPVQGASVTVLDQAAAAATTGRDGGFAIALPFQIPANTLGLAEVFVAGQLGAQVATEVSAPALVVPDGFTDVGIVRLGGSRAMVGIGGSVVTSSPVLFVVDASTLSVQSSLDFGPLNAFALSGIAVTPDGEGAVVADFKNGVRFLDLTTDPPTDQGLIQVVGSLPQYASVCSACPSTRRFALTRSISCNTFGCTSWVHSIDVAKRAVADFLVFTASTGIEIYDLSVAPDGTFALAADQPAALVHLIRIAADGELSYSGTFAPTGAPAGTMAVDVEVSPSGDLALVANTSLGAGPGSVGVVAISQSLGLSLVDSLRLDGTGVVSVAFDPGGARAFAYLPFDGVVAVLDVGPSGGVTDSGIRVTGLATSTNAAGALEVTADGAYVIAHTRGGTEVIDATTYVVIGTIPILFDDNTGPVARIP